MSRTAYGELGAAPGTVRAASEPVLDEVLASARTDGGESLLAMSRRGPVLLLLVRHSGCTFCGEALSDLARARAADPRVSALAAVVVQMGTAEQGRRLLDRHGLADVPVVSDPERRLYRALELGRGSLRQLFGPRVWWRGLLATLRGHLIGRLVGDGFQMPGAFVIEGGRVVRAFRHRDAADRPDLAAMCRLDGGTDDGDGEEDRVAGGAAGERAGTAAGRAVGGTDGGARRGG